MNLSILLPLQRKLNQTYRIDVFSRVKMLAFCGLVGEETRKSRENRSPILPHADARNPTQGRSGDKREKNP